MGAERELQDYVVAGVAIALAIFALAAAVLNWETAFQLNKLRWLEARWGRRSARIVLAVIGATMLLAAAAILRRSS